MTSGESYLLDINLQVSNAKAFDELTRNLAGLNQQAKQTGQTQKQLATTTQQMGSAWNGAQYHVRNVSYQLTDFFVMLQGGMGVTRSLATQLPQLLAGFGALGAAAGLATVLVIPLVAAMNSTAEVTGDVTKITDELSEAYDLVEKKLIKATNAYVKYLEKQREEVIAASRKTVYEQYADDIETFGAKLERLTEARETASIIQDQRARGEVENITRARIEAQKNVTEQEKANQKLVSSLNDIGERFKNNNITLDQLTQAYGELGDKAPAALKKLIEFLKTVELGTEGLDNATNKLKDAYDDLIKDLDSAIAKFNEAGLSQSEVFQKQLNSLLGLTDAQKAQAQGLIDQIAVLEEIEDIEEGLAEFEKEVAADRQKYQDLYTDALNSALTPAELLANETARVAQEMRKLDFTDEQIEKVTKFLEDSADNTKTLGESIQDRLIASTDEAASAMEEFAAGNKRAFKDMTKSIIKDITAMILQYYLLALAQKAVGLFGGGDAAASGAAASGGASTVTRALPLSTTVALPLAAGYSRTIPATPRAAAPISNMQASGISSIQPNVNVNVSNYTNAEVTTTQNQNGDIEMIISQISDRVRRGGNVFSKSLEGVYGVSRAKGAF